MENLKPTFKKIIDQFKEVKIQEWNFGFHQFSINSAAHSCNDSKKLMNSKIA